MRHPLSVLIGNRRNGADARAARGLRVPLPILFLLLMLLVIMAVFDILKKSHDVHVEANRRVATAILESTLTKANSGLNGIATRLAAQDPDLSLDETLPEALLANEPANIDELSARALVIQFDEARAILGGRLGHRPLGPRAVAALASQPALARLFARRAAADQLAATRMVLVGRVSFMLSEPRPVRTATGEAGPAFVAIGLPVKDLVFDELAKYEVFRSGDLKAFLDRQSEFTSLAELIVSLQNREYAQFHFSAVAQILIVLVAFVIAIMIGHHVDETSDALRRSRDTIADREHEAQRLREIAERASEAKSQFIHNMSHELRTPLNAILGYAELIANEAFGKLVGPAARYKEFAGSIHKGGTRLLNEVSRVLEYSALIDGNGPRREKAIDLGELLLEVAAPFRAEAASRGVALDVAAVPDLPHLWADREMIAGLFHDLVSNAVKFSPDGARVTVTQSVAADGGIAVAVGDRGAGMDRALIDAAFDPFVHGEDVYARRHQGMGLGLSLARAYAQHHDATIAIESAPGAGTVATVAFPPARSVAAAAAAPRLAQGAA